VAVSRVPLDIALERVRSKLFDAADVSSSKLVESQP
jgi:hypothetical protein